MNKIVKLAVIVIVILCNLSICSRGLAKMGTTRYVTLNQVLDVIKSNETGNRADANNAVSWKGAQGAYQFMPATWAEYGQGSDIHDPNAQRRAAANYITDLYKKFGRVDLAVAGYNGGVGGAVFIRDNYKYVYNPDEKASRDSYRRQTAGYVNQFFKKMGFNVGDDVYLTSDVAIAKDSTAEYNKQSTIDKMMSKMPTGDLSMSQGGKSGGIVSNIINYATMTFGALGLLLAFNKLS